MSREKKNVKEWMEAEKLGAWHAIHLLQYRRDLVADECEAGFNNKERADYVLMMTIEINQLIKNLREDGIID